MTHQKLLFFSDTATTHRYKFTAKICVEINLKARGTFNKKKLLQLQNCNVKAKFM